MRRPLPGRGQSSLATGGDTSISLPEELENYQRLLTRRFFCSQLLISEDGLISKAGVNSALLQISLPPYSDHTADDDFKNGVEKNL